MKKPSVNTWMFLAWMVPALHVGPAAAADDPLTRMFEWWNEAFQTPGAFTEEAFRQHFTEDAVLIVDGIRSASGIGDLAHHFQEIQALPGFVRIVLPFTESFTSGDRIFTYHFVHRVRDGQEQCMRAMGYAVVENGKLALIDLVRVPHDAEKAVGPGCTANE